MQEFPKSHTNYSSGAIIWEFVHPTQLQLCHWLIRLLTKSSFFFKTFVNPKTLELRIVNFETMVTTPLCITQEEEEDQNPKTLKYFSPYKIGCLEKIQTEADFFLWMASLTRLFLHQSPFMWVSFVWCILSFCLTIISCENVVVQIILLLIIKCHKLMTPVEDIETNINVKFQQYSAQTFVQ